MTLKNLSIICKEQEAKMDAHVARINKQTQAIKRIDLGPWSAVRNEGAGDMKPLDNYNMEHWRND